MAPLPLLDHAESLPDATPALAVTTVLVADDDDGVRGLLCAYLEAEGLSVESVSTGRDALTQVGSGSFDVVFLDVEMPGQTGLEVLAAIREQRLHTAVVITTAYGSEDVLAEALRRGADDYLRKPFDRADLQAILDRTTARLLLVRQNEALRLRLEQQQRHLENELAKAAQVVSELMPATPPAIEGFDLAAVCVAAREVGGDFYDWQRLPSGELSLTVGDVMGKGLSAALLMASVRAVFRAIVGHSDPANVVQRTAAALDSDLTRSGAFVTLFHAQLHPPSGFLRFVDAGHGYVLLARADGTTEELKPWGLPLGVDTNERFQEGHVIIAPGDTLLIYSDGLTEARPDLFNDRARLASYLRCGVDAADIVNDLLAQVEGVTPLPDDLTVAVLRRQLVAAVV